VVTRRGETHTTSSDKDETETRPRKSNYSPDDGNLAETPAELDEWDSGEHDGVEEEEEVVFYDPLHEGDADDSDEAEEIERELVDQEFLDALGESVKLSSGAVDKDALRLMRWGPVDDQNEAIGTPSFPNFTTASVGSRKQLDDVHDNPTGLFFAFFCVHCGKKMRLSQTATSGRLAEPERQL
jgi:hypothetical protein